MVGRFGQISVNSIRFKLVIGVLIVILPLIILLTYSNFYAINVVRNQVAKSNKDMVSLYMQQIDDNLRNVDKYLSYFAAFNIDLSSMESYNQEYRYGAVITLNNKISKDILIYKSIDSLFIYSPSMKHFIEAYNEGESLNDREEVRSFITNSIDCGQRPDYFLNDGWFAKKIHQEYYLLRIYKSGNTYVGAWVNTRKLLISLNLINFGEKGASLFVTDQGEPMEYEELIYNNNIDLKRDFQHYFISGNKQKFLVVGEESKVGQFSLLALIPEEKILENLPNLQRITTLISVSSVILLPLFLIFLRKSILIPLKRIVAAMKRIGEGNLNTRIEKYSTSDEFQLVNTTFNSMMSQIQELKINVYEEKLHKQKAELQFLQLQIKPHFFLNSLNILYSLAQSKKYELIQEMVLCMVQYFRYTLRSNTTFVQLKDELAHIRNYIKMHELRFPRSLIYNIDAPVELLETALPPMTIQTFVENTVKHAVTLDLPIHLSIKISETLKESEHCLMIAVQDTGIGFSANVLVKLRSGERIIDGQGEHIGIKNVRQRLKLLYEDKAELIFSNVEPTGCVVRLILPIMPFDQYQDRRT